MFLIIGYTRRYMKWKQIPQVGGNYECNTNGEIRRVLGTVKFGKQTRKVGGNVLKPKTKKNGYLEVNLTVSNTSKSFYVHRLIAAAWLDMTTNNLQVNHKDGDKSNNTIRNLEVVTQSQNMVHAYKLGLIKPRNFKGSHHPNARTNEEEVVKIRHEHTNHHSIKRLLIDYPHLTKPILTKIVYRESWKHVIVL